MLWYALLLRVHASKMQQIPVIGSRSLIDLMVMGHCSHAWLSRQGGDSSWEANAERKGIAAPLGVRWYNNQWFLQHFMEIEQPFCLVGDEHWETSSKIIKNAVFYRPHLPLLRSFRKEGGQKRSCFSLFSICFNLCWQLAKYNIRPINAALASVLHEIQFASPVCLSHSTAAPTSIRP